MCCPYGQWVVLSEESTEPVTAVVQAWDENGAEIVFDGPILRDGEDPIGAHPVTT